MEDQIESIITRSYQEIEKVSSDMVEAIHTAYAAIKFYDDSTDNKKKAGILLAVSALQTFSQHIIMMAQEFIENNPDSDFVHFYQKTKDYHSDILKNLTAFESSYKEQLFLYGY